MADLSDILKEMDNNVKLQFLQDSVVQIKDKKRTKDTEITFATCEVDCNEFARGDKTGMVIWFSREEFNAAVAKLNNKE